MNMLDDASNILPYNQPNGTRPGLDTGETQQRHHIAGF